MREKMSQRYRDLRMIRVANGEAKIPIDVAVKIEPSRFDILKRKRGSEGLGD